MKGELLSLLLSVLFLTIVPGSSVAQHETRPAGAAASLWPLIETRLAQQQPSDTSFHFILTLVLDHCDGDFDCLNHTYNALMDSLEGRFNLPGAIFVGKELVDVARKHKATKIQAQARLDLCRFHDALGNARLAAFNIEKALILFEEAGDQRGAALCRYWKLKISLKYRKTEEVMPAMEALLEEVIAQKDTGIIVRLHQELVELNCSSGRYEKMDEHLDALEAITKSNPSTREEKRYRMLILLGRGDLARATSDFEGAKRFYHNTLLSSQDVSDRWIEIRCLQFLAEMEWEIGNRSSAKSYLERANTLAEKLHLEDLLIYSYGIDARFAETEGRYADALESTKKKHSYEASWVNRGAGRNAQNYFLEAEKENKELELSNKKAQLRYSLIIVVLAFLFVAGLLIGLYKQRKGKQAMAAQNILIRQQAEQLKSLDAAKSRFFANVSHELRTPLTLLRGPVHTLLKENKLTEKQTKLLQMAERSGKQLEQLVNEILDLRKLEMGKMDVDEKPTGLSTFFRTYFAQFESLAESRQIDFTFDLSGTHGVVAGIDREKCRQILYNLLSNAFKFTPTNGRIAAAVSVNDGTLRLTVSDTGAGIHPDDLPFVFDRFFQTNRPDKPAEGGTGIGLNLCYEYARLFGGTIEAESTPGEGSVFRVAFPVRLVEANDETLSAPTAQIGMPAHDEAEISSSVGASEVSQSSKPTILVVEDNPDLQDYIRFILQEKYNVVTAENGRTALERLKVEGRGLRGDGPLPSTLYLQPSLILSDLMMPVMDGYQLLERLKSHDATCHIPTIMLTARAEAQERLKALRIGVDDYLTKPFDEEELLARIENLLKNQAARQQEAAAEAGQETPRPVMSQPDREWLEIFEAYVQKHFDSDILNVPALACEFAMSESTLLRQLKRLTGLSPIQYLQEVRLDEARRLLENHMCNSIAQVASKVGYDDARSFARAFRQRFGKLPSEMM